MGLALALHSQNENGGSVTSAVMYMASASNPCLLLFLLAFSVSITTVAIPGRCDNGSDPRTPTATPVESEVVGRYGAMIPHRIVMGAFTGLYIAAQACPVGETIRMVFAPPSLAAAIFHIGIGAEEESVGWPVKAHFIFHSSEFVIRGVRYFCEGDVGRAVVMGVYFTVLFPAIFNAASRFCSSARSHGRESSAKLVAVSFVTFWSTVTPVVLYLGADTLGTRPIFVS
jgi:hypothetical protein